MYILTYKTKKFNETTREIENELGECLIEAFTFKSHGLIEFVVRTIDGGRDFFINGKDVVSIKEVNESEEKIWKDKWMKYIRG